MNKLQISICLVLLSAVNASDAISNNNKNTSKGKYIIYKLYEVYKGNRVPSSSTQKINILLFGEGLPSYGSYYSSASSVGEARFVDGDRKFHASRGSTNFAEISIYKNTNEEWKEVINKKGITYIEKPNVMYNIDLQAVEKAKEIESSVYEWYVRKLINESVDDIEKSSRAYMFDGLIYYESSIKLCVRIAAGALEKPDEMEDGFCDEWPPNDKEKTVKYCRMAHKGGWLYDQEEVLVKACEKWLPELRKP